MIRTSIDALLIGGPKPFRADGAMSAMAREVVNRPVMMRKLGFEGDQVADPTVHGGLDKAVHLYCTEHYPFWSVELGGHDLLNAPGAFGENITASGLLEGGVKIGDRFRIGDALVEVSQGRQPCWKLDHRFGMTGITAGIVRTRRGGLYFRVIEEGAVAPGDIIQQIASPNHDWTVDKVFHLLISGGHKRPDAKAALVDLAHLETLAENWRRRAHQLAGAS